MRMPVLLLAAAAIGFLQAGEVLFHDDFSAGALADSWIFYGDPEPVICDSLGSPAPSFCNNGDADVGSGVVTREIFEIGPGFFVECDMYVTCSERGTWVTTRLEMVTPDHRNDDNTESDFMLARMDLSYSGELDWMCPHRQGVFSVACFHDMEERYTFQRYHQNHLLDGWHTYRMEINDDLTVSYFVDDSLYHISTISIPDTCGSVRIKLGDRSSEWGIALHDNLTVGRL